MLRVTPLTERLLRLENFFWAWEKAKASYSFDKTWFDEVELAAFESNLRTNLLEIRSRFATGQYLLDAARPVAFPKRGETRDQPSTRQMFWFAVRDQVAWLALVNVIGPPIDRLMPAWSYGDRLYRSVWRTRSDTDTDAGVSRGSLKIGPYRHSSRHLYRPFKYAWPRYRRHLYLSAIVMAKGGATAALSPEDQELLEEELSIASDQVRVPYLDARHWTSSPKDVYWASIDLKKFFPNTPLSLVLGNLTEGLRLGRYRGELDGLIASMLELRVDSRGWTDAELRDALSLDGDQRNVFTSIPTGLLVSGFLANTAMLNADRRVDQELGTYDPSAEHRIAHFRYVDDHTFLATDPDDLVRWIGKYQEILEATNSTWKINISKTAPASVRDRIETSGTQGRPDVSKIKLEPLDPDFPRPLLSHTLAKISAVAATRFELLDDDSQAQFIRDVEMLLLGDFGDSEVRPETRASFAASVLARSDLHLRRLTTTTWQRVHELQNCHARVAWLNRELEKYQPECVPAALVEELDALVGRLPELQKAEREADASLRRSRSRDKARHFRLILSAIRRFPDKIRIWLTAVRYCGRVGHHGLQDLSLLLRDPAVIAPLTESYVSGVVAHCIATEVLRAVRILGDGAADEDAKSVASSFLESAVNTRFVLTSTPRWYETRAVAMLTAAAWAAEVALETARPADLLEVASQRKPHPRFLMVARGHGNPVAAARQTRKLASAGVDASFLAVWLDRSMETDSAKPTVVWSALAPLVKPDAPGAPSFFGRFPRQVPTRVLLAIVNGDVPEFSTNQGWYYEAISDRSAGDLQRLRQASRRTRRKAGAVLYPLLARKPPSRVIPLSTWVEWLRSYPGDSKLSLERASDPRRGEWTCLQIIRSVAKEIRRRRRHDRPAIHHATIGVPLRWTSVLGSAPGGLTWGEWTSVVKNARVQFIEPAISDERYMGPGWPLLPGDPADWPWIRALGLLLLGLLNKSFVWPTPWNPDFWQNGRPEVVSRTVGRIACSSLTTALLQSTLAARARENVIRRHDLTEEQLDPDTLFDPPFVASLADLETWLGRAMRALEVHQMSGHQGRPRQLVPVMLRQLTRPEWSSLIDGEGR